MKSDEALRDTRQAITKLRAVMSALEANLRVLPVGYDAGKQVVEAAADVASSLTRLDVYLRVELEASGGGEA